MPNHSDGFELITDELIDRVIAEARQSPRKRKNYNFHEMDDTAQRMLNAVEPGSYITPHRHLDPPKTETFLVLRGEFWAFIFDDAGEVIRTVRLSETGIRGIDFLPGVWHTVAALTSGSIFLEIKPGPYVAANDKDFASFAPREGGEDCDNYLQRLLQIAEN